MTIKEIWRLLSGAAIVTGTTVGAGMLAIPTKTAGLWYEGSLLVLLVTWAIMMFSGLLILEASQGFDERANFPTIVRSRLGNYWAGINSLSLAFVLYILVYAYITVGGSITSSSLNSFFTNPLPNYVGKLLFFVVLGIVVWLSHHWVARFNALIVGGLFLTFFMAIGGMLPDVKSSNLFPTTGGGEWKYLLPTLPVILTSFGYHINVPTLRVYFRNNNKRVAWAVIIGTFIALILYTLWQTAIQGNLPRNAFAPIIKEDGAIPVLISAIKAHSDGNLTARLLSLFTYFAIVTSFLGVALGLFEFIADFMTDFFGLQGLHHTTKGRFLVAVIALLPPAGFSFVSPYGFVTAIGYAGLALTIWSLIIPAMMVYQVRKKAPEQTQPYFRVWGGNILLVVTVIFAVINIAAQILERFNMIPSFHG